MKVHVYVEGPSDQKALQALLKPIIDAGRERRVGINFLELNGKVRILDEVPRKAAKTLMESPEDWVFALPDLYPMATYAGTHNEHKSFEDLVQLLRKRFLSRADKVALPEAVRSHFRIHCLKHDLEVLLLAATDELKKRLDTKDALRGHWRIPVEDQNDTKPPKRIIEDLVRRYLKRKYQDTDDAVVILKRASLPALEKACPQRFAPFVAELRALAEGRDPDSA